MGIVVRRVPAVTLAWEPFQALVSTVTESPLALSAARMILRAFRRFMLVKNRAKMPFRQGKIWENLPYYLNWRLAGQNYIGFNNAVMDALLEAIEATARVPIKQA